MQACVEEDGYDALNDDEEEATVIGAEEDDVEAQKNKMGAEYDASTMCLILKSSYTPSAASFSTKGGVMRPCYYFNADTIVFPPSSDQSETQMETIKDILTTAHESLKSGIFSEKIMLFPVTEEQQYFFFQRKHWVTLHYNPKTGHATVIDSRPWYISFMYSINAMRKLLVEGLEQFELRVNSFEVKHQGVQLDNIHCGAWTAANIASLVACRLPAKMQAFFPTDKERIIQANIEKVCPTKSGMCGSTNPSTDSLASTAGLSDDDTWEKVSSVSHI